MKSKIIVLFGAILLLVSCNSKTKRDEIQINSQSSDFTQLTADLRNYNSSFVDLSPSISSTPELRGFWGWIGKIGRVIASDAVGAIVGSPGGPVGSVVVGVSASVGAIIGLQSESQDQSPYMYAISIDSSELPFELRGKVEEANDVGYLHNAIIYNLFSSNPDILNYSESEVKRALFSIFENISNIPELKSLYFYFRNHSMEQVSSQIELSQNVAKKLVSGDFLERADFVKAISQSASISLEEADILAEYCIVVSQIDDLEEINQYAQGYSEIVLKSNVSTRVKSMIVMFTSVATNSKVLWSRML